MASERRLVLDANILLRAVLGRRVRQIIEANVEHATFFTPDVAIADAWRHLPDIVRNRGGDDSAVDAALEMLDALARNIDAIDAAAYVAHREAALARIEMRDPDDWPILATAMALECPVWTRGQRLLRHRGCDLDQRPRRALPEGQRVGAPLPDF